MGVYRVVAQVGRGGQGHVFKAEWRGRLFALKFFRAWPFASRGQREIDILRWLELANVVRVLGYGRWPDPERGYLYLAMEWVEGWDLDEHVRVRRLSARELVPLVLKLVRALAGLHQRGVLHRDLKPDNVRVRQGTGEPVVVDFGVGHLDGFESVEGGHVLGTPEYNSPEALQFAWEHLGTGLRYQQRLTDEVWALGITLYQVMTGSLPFGSRLSNERLVTDIRTKPVPPPHERHARVPVGLSRACMRLLERDPRERCADMSEVEAVLEQALEEAAEDGAWDVPLEPAALTPDEFSEPVPPPLPREVPPAVRPAVAQDVAPPRPPVEYELWKRAPAPLPAPSVHPEPRPVRRVRSGALVGALPVWAWLMPSRWRVLGMVLLVAAGVGVGVLLTRPAEDPKGRQPSPEPRMSPASVRTDPTQDARVFRGVAGPGQVNEGGGVSLPFMPPTPVSPFTTAMLNPNPAREKIIKTPSPRPVSRERGCVAVKKWVCTAGLCSFVMMGCAEKSQVTRPFPSVVQSFRVACPPGTLESLKALKIRDSITYQLLIGDALKTRILLREGPIDGVLLADVGELPKGTHLRGELFLEDDRVYGHFTQAITPQNEAYPVCAEVDPDSFGPGAICSERRGDVCVYPPRLGVQFRKQFFRR